MLGISGQPAYEDGAIVPHVAHGLKAMSVGLLTKMDDAMIWRGPMASQAITQMLTQTRWGTADAPLDVLVVDLPPGTGDVQLTLIQKTPLDGAVIVSTPQEVALADARRAYTLFQRVNVPTFGLIENMSGPVFGEGGGMPRPSAYPSRFWAPCRWTPPCERAAMPDDRLSQPIRRAISPAASPKSPRASRRRSGFRKSRGRGFQTQPCSPPWVLQIPKEIR